jgi:hypothetical protein
VSAFFLPIAATITSVPIIIIIIIIIMDDYYYLERASSSASSSASESDSNSSHDNSHSEATKIAATTTTRATTSNQQRELQNMARNNRQGCKQAFPRVCGDSEGAHEETASEGAINKDKSLPVQFQKTEYHCESVQYGCDCMHQSNRMLPHAVQQRKYFNDGYV